MGNAIIVPRWVSPPDPYHLSVRQDYRLRPYILEITVCGLTVERWLTRAFHDLPWTIEEQRRQFPGCCVECAETAYAEREALAEGVRAFLKEALP